jgi:hypothetical protein
VSTLSRPKVATYDVIRGMEDTQFLACASRFAMTFKLHDAYDASYRDRMFLPIDEPTLDCVWAQWRTAGLGVARSVPVTAFKLKIDDAGRVVADHRCNVSARDAAITNYRDPRFLGHDVRSTTQAAFVLLNAIINSREDDTLAAVPTLPEFYFGYYEPPDVELSYRLIDDARAADPGAFAGNAMPVDYLREFWYASVLERDGYAFVPQRYLHRDPTVDYEIHPSKNSPKPSTPPVEGQRTSDWVVVDDRWVPEIQTPVAVMADMSPVMGRFSRNLAYRFLIMFEFLPAQTYRAWAEDAARDPSVALRLRESIMAAVATRPDTISRLIGVFREEAGVAISARISDDDIVEALCDPRRPLVESYGAKSQLVGLGAPACRENLRFATSAWDIRPYDVKHTWAHGFAPYIPVDANRRQEYVGTFA